MHDLVRNQLEELLAGQLAGPARQEIEAHLAACAGCRETVQKMRSHSRLVASLRAPASMEPAAGFYARVLQSIEDQGRPSFWHLLLDPVFGRRLMYATAALVLMMGTILFVTAPEHPELALTPV
jgi:anti-sigma factor RsiW